MPLTENKMKEFISPSSSAESSGSNKLWTFSEASDAKEALYELKGNPMLIISGNPSQNSLPLNSELKNREIMSSKDFM